MPKILFIFGTRPEAIKLAPVIGALERTDGMDVSVAVTAQHREMLDQVLNVFGIEPDFDLDLMSKEQDLYSLTAKAVEGLKKVIKDVAPDLVIVQGDTTTAFVGALAAYYAKIEVGHIEAGLRTGNHYSPFPEEVNRKLIGVLSSLHFAPTKRAKDNLLKEGVSAERIFVTGNTAIDALLWTLKNKETSLNAILGLESHSLLANRFVLVTTHRRESFGGPMADVMSALSRLADEFCDLSIVFPVHLNPKVKNLAHDVLGKKENVFLLKPVDYVSFVHLMAQSHIILTDSGGVQEEAPSLGKPILVLRETTERPEGVLAGVAKIVGTNADRIYKEAARLLTDAAYYRIMAKSENPYGDGKAAIRIADIVVDYLRRNTDTKNSHA
jgi:UDP-N-acetylglucosamine 2-epimerase (non-hydrolysing)